MAQGNGETLDDLIASAESLKAALDNSQESISVDLLRAAARTAAALLAHGHATLSSELIDFLRRLATAVDCDISGCSDAAISYDASEIAARGADTQHMVPASARALASYFLGVELLRCARSGVPIAGEQAVAYLNEALDLTNPTGSPLLWASIHEQLGRAFSRSTSPDCERSRDAARRHFAAAQTVFNEATDPLHWSRLQLQLARTFACSSSAGTGHESRSADASKAISYVRDAVNALREYDQTTEAHLAREYLRVLEGLLAMTSHPVATSGNP